jgi:glycosyltransferase involved in cell wall biosynthesis/2-polyprenyl-3-methyl-5-hydroxy-6-metoxy-1,4-benzoquinol methylase
MKILFVYQFCTLGGVETVLRNRLPEFHKKGIYPEVVFLCDLGGSKIFEGFRNIRYGCSESELAKIIIEGNFDFVIPIDTPQVYPALGKSRFNGIVVTEVHTNNLDNLKYLSNIGETETKAIITPSRFEKELIYKEIKGFEKNGIPIYIVPNPINLEHFQFKEPRFKPNKKIIGWVGRLEKEKNWKHFLEIASFLSKKRNDLVFLVIGGYSEGEAVKREFFTIVKRLDLIDHLKWVPYLQYERMPGAYSLMGVSGGCLVPTSVLEPFGMTAIEAMTCQCPVVAARVGGFKEIIEEGKNGLLFEVNNTMEALNKIEVVIDDTPQRTRFIENGCLTVNETYSSEKVVNKYLGVLRKLVREIPSPRNSFEQAVYEFFESGKGAPMYETYIRYALTTNVRGEELVHHLSQFLKFKNISYLDIGTAYGGFLVAFSKQGCRPYLGIEIDGKLVELCKLNLIENRLASDCVQQLDICGPLPNALKGRRFDIITCTDVLEHVSDVPKALENIKSLMADGGHLYLEIPNRYHVNNVLSDPHFGLFGITLLEQDDAIEYFRYLRAGDYLVTDYHELDYYLSFFPGKSFEIKKLQTDNIDLKRLKNLFNKEIKETSESKVESLFIPVEMREKLKLKFRNYIDQYLGQISQRETERFYTQNWKILIHKNDAFDRHGSFPGRDSSKELRIHSLLGKEWTTERQNRFTRGN